VPFYISVGQLASTLANGEIVYSASAEFSGVRIIRRAAAWKHDCNNNR